MIMIEVLKPLFAIFTECIYEVGVCILMKKLENFRKLFTNQFSIIILNAIIFMQDEMKRKGFFFF